MTKRRIERAVEEASEEVLGELDPDERLRWLIEAHARDKPLWIDRLRETCSPDQLLPTFGRWQAAYFVATEDVYDLHTTALEYRYLEAIQSARMSIDCYRDESPAEATLETAAARAETIRAQFAALYVMYHTDRRFATDVLDVDVATWLSLHKNGTAVLDLVEDQLENPTQRRLAREWAAAEPALPVEDPDDALEACIEQRYEGRVALWEDLVDLADQL